MSSDPDDTAYRFDEASAFKFKVVSAEMPRPRIAWRDFPIPAETLLTLTPDLPECERVQFYAADASNQVREIEGKSFLALANTDAEGLRDRNDPCGVWISGAVHRGDGFPVCTLTFATRDGPIRSLELRVRERSPWDGWFWDVTGLFFFVTFDLAFSIALSPVIVPMAVHARVAAAPLDAGPVTVRVTAPDGASREVTVTNADFERLHPLDPFDFGRPVGASEPLSKLCRGVRCWSRMAVLELGLDFREEATYVRDEEGLHKYLIFSMLDGHDGAWVYRLHGRRDEYYSLTGGLAYGKGIYFRSKP